MDKNILPIYNTSITHSPPIANLFSILGTNQNTNGWVMNNFVNIYIHRNGIFDNFYDRNTFFHGCPWIQVVQTRKEIVELTYVFMIDYIKMLLKNDFYVYVVIDTQYIKAYNGNHPKGHNAFVYGFDDNEKEFFISDFASNGKYGTIKCSYEEMEVALRKSNMNDSFVYLIYGMKLKKIEYKFEVDVLIEKIEDYLHSTNLFCKYKTRQEEEFYSYKGDNCYYYFSYAEMKDFYFFGLSYYDKILEMIVSKSTKLLRPLDLLYEHKLLMIDRLRFLQDNNYLSLNDYNNLSNDCEELLQQSLIIRNLHIKSLISGKETESEKIKRKIVSLKEKDEYFMMRFSKFLKTAL